MSMQYISMELGPIMTNCYVVYDSDTKEAMVVDPAWDYNAIDRALSRYELDLKFIFLTHGHADHIGALQELRQRKNVPVYVGAGDAGLISNSHHNLSMFMGQPIECTSADHLSKDGGRHQPGDAALQGPGNAGPYAGRAQPLWGRRRLFR